MSADQKQLDRESATRALASAFDETLTAEIERNTSECKGCGQKILWAHTTGGGRVPLDARAVTYTLGIGDVGGEEWKLKAYKTNAPTKAYVNHFSTCMRADDFSRKKRL